MTLTRRQALARAWTLPLVWASVQAHAQTQAPTQTDTKPLIVYLSRTGNTQAVARMVQARTGGVLHALETVQPYPADYRQTVNLVSQQNQRGEWPAVQPVPNLAQYQQVFIGFPVWGMQLPPPVKTFLRDADWRDKTIVPFSTYGTVGEGWGFDEVATLCARQGCTVAPGLSLKGGTERDGVLLAIEGERAQEVQTAVQRWLQDLDY